MHETVDHTNGGFIGQIDGNDIKNPGSTKGIILNARILWTYSAAYNYDKKPEYSHHAERAYLYIRENFVDRELGGVYWEIDASGRPVNTKKQIYAQAFTIYALSEYYQFSKDEDALKLAISIFNLIEKHSFDTVYNGYFEAYDREWNLLEDLRLSDKDANEKKTMNTHLHVLEAYTNLLRIWPDEVLKKQLENLVLIHIDKIYNAANGHLDLFFGEQWEKKSHEYSFGHDIEAAWLLCDAANELDNKTLKQRVDDLAVRIADLTLREGIDVDGALLNEGLMGKVTDPDKHWWPQAEAIIGFINAWQIDKNQKLLDAAINCWDFTNETIIDHENGEWYFRVNRRGEPYFDEDKVGFWKCPYHNGRAMIETLKRISNVPNL